LARFQCYHVGDGCIRWRLLGGNNRQLGVACGAHSDVGSAIGEIAVVKASLRLECFEIARSENGRWSWLLVPEGRRLARGAQSFARRVDALLAARRFMTRAAQARVDERLAVFSWIGGTAGGG
jgi:hypothetical protein